MAEPRMENVEGTGQSSLARAEGVVSIARKQGEARLGQRLAAAAAGAALVFFAACGGSSEAPEDVSVQPPAAAAAAEAIPQATAAPQVEVKPTPKLTPEPKRGITDQEREVASVRMEEVRAVIDEFLKDSPIAQKMKEIMPSTADRDFPPPSDPKKYDDAVEEWVKAERGEFGPNTRFERRDQYGNTTYGFDFGEGFGWGITINRDPSGGSIGASVVFTLREDPSFYGKIYGLEIERILGELYGNDTWTTRDGRQAPLLISRENMSKLADSAFTLPKNLQWKETSSEVEGGRRPGMTASFTTKRGPAQITVDGDGLVRLVANFQP